MASPGRKPFMNREEWAHLSVYISPKDKEFIEKFAKETYRDQTSVLRLAINELRKQYNEKGAKHGI